MQLFLPPTKVALGTDKQQSYLHVSILAFMCNAEKKKSPSTTAKPHSVPVQ